MTTTRLGLITGGVLAGALLLGTVGLVAAQDPTPTPAPRPTPVSATMMGGQMGAGMMGGQMGAGMMDSEQLERMMKLHDQMAKNGVCDPTQMHEFYAEPSPAR